MPKLWRVKMGATAIYIIIGVLAFTACISIAISGESSADSSTGIDVDREVDIETDEGDTDED